MSNLINCSHHVKETAKTIRSAERKTEAPTKLKKLKKHGENGEFYHGRISASDISISDDVRGIPISIIQVSPENDELYKPIDPNESDFRAHVKSIRETGILEPVILTLDDYLLSGHRRYAAAKIVGLREVPSRRINIMHADPRFVVLLRECNRQRVKSIDEILREEVISVNKDDAYDALIQYRADAAHVEVATEEIEGETRRARITEAKAPFLDAIRSILERLTDFWPLSDRLIHYQLLNDPPLIHASKPRSVYRNDKKSYQALTELLTRARIFRIIPFEAIADPTRPVKTWDVYDSPGPFIRRQLDRFLQGYRRNLQRSQPCHIEILGEKNTVQSIIHPVAGNYHIPYTLGRGYSSLDPRHKMAQRFRKSGKVRLILLVVSDHDPEGVNIPHSFARSMRDDFNIFNIKFIRVALRDDQIRDFHLPRGQKAADKDGSRKRKFIERYGEYTHELESLEPEQLQEMLRQHIEAVLNLDLFRQEQEKERDNAAQLAAFSKTIHRMLANIELPE
jgi:hypothetical protein